jgi:hypothetical protein
MSDNRIEKLGKTDSNRDVIELYLVSEEGQVLLNDKQKELLQRWQYADELIRQHVMKRSDIAVMIEVKFKVSKVTALQDIVNAENLFASSTPLNKRYRIQLRIEFLEMKISELYGMVHLKPVDEAGNEIPAEEESVDDKISRIQDNQEYLHEAKELEKVLQKYYHDYPDIVAKKPPRKIVYNILYNTLPQPTLTPEEALKAHTIYINPKSDGDSK